MYTDNRSILKKDRYNRTEEIYYTKCNIFENYLYIYIFTILLFLYSNFQISRTKYSYSFIVERKIDFY